MAIIIPSKNIYRSQKTILKNNALKGISISANIPNIVDEIDVPVYSSPYQYLPTVGDGTLSSNVSYYRDVDGFRYSYVAIRPKYSSGITFDIPKTSDGKTITNVSLKKIDISFSGYLSKAVVKQKISYLDVGAGVPSDTQPEPTFFDTISKEKYTISKNGIPNEADGSEGVKASFTDFSKTPTLVELGENGENGYRVTFEKLLTGYEIYRTSTEEKNIPSYAVGTCEDFAPETISISVNGNTYSIDLHTSIISIGEKSNSFSVDGSDLLQTTNSPRLEQAYQKTLDLYKNGKEVATIVTSIGDYYDESGSLSISNKKSIDLPINIVPNYNTSITATQQLKKSTIYRVPSNLNVSWFHNIGGIYLDNGKYEYTVNALSRAYGRVKISELENGSDNAPSIADGMNIKGEIEVGTGKTVYIHFCSDVDNNGNNPAYEFEISFKKIGVTKMVFDVGDIVMPKVRDAYGVDNPISLYRDKTTPKLFRVCGTKLYYDGAVWQELTLQEVSKEV